ncbi:hypothetical protein [Profundibacter sp.]
MNDKRKTAIEFACKHLQAVFKSLSHIEANTGIGAEELDFLDILECLSRASRVGTGPATDWAVRGQPLWEEQLVSAWHQGLTPENNKKPESFGYSASLRQLIKAADQNATIFDALCIHGAQNISNDTQMPTELRDFLVAVLTGKRPRPSRTGRPKVNSSRDALIFAVILEVAEEFRLKPTRNDASTHQMSACDIVAEAMRQMRHSPSSYTALKKIWVEQNSQE